jgi:hypothetical protein
VAAGLALVGVPVVASDAMDSSKEFEVEMPVGVDSARSVFLELSDVQLPRMASVVLRARSLESVAGIVTELPLGSIGLLAESKNAEGVTRHALVRIEVTKRLKRWRQDHPGISTLRIRVVPFAGADPLPHLQWSAASAQLSLSGS